MKFKVQQLKILSVLLLLGGLNFQQVFAENPKSKRQDATLSDKGSATAIAQISTKAEACVKQLSITGTSSSLFTTYSGAKLLSSQSWSTGIGTSSTSFGGSISGSVNGIQSETVSYSQQTTATGTWSSGSSYWNNNYSATASAKVTINSTQDLGVQIDRTAPYLCLLQSNNSGYVSSSGQVYVRPGAQVSFSWNAEDRGCAGLDNKQIVGGTTAPQNNGYYTYSKRLCDKLDNCVENKCMASYNVDGTAPTCSSINLSTTSWTNKPVTISASGCSDSGSGFKGCTTKTVSSNGTASITCRDNVGNSVTYSKNVSNIDTVAPTCVNTTVARPSSGIYVRTFIPMSTGCSDGQSGCTASNYNGTAINGSGTITIADNAGNTTACSVSYNFSDTSAPTTMITFDNAHKNNGEAEYTNDDFITATVSAVDNGNAGVNRVCYKLEGATNQSATCVNGNSTSFEISNEGITKITAWSYDNAYDYSAGNFVYTTGNKSTDVTKSAYIDRTKPNLVDYTADDEIYECIIRLSSSGNYQCIKCKTNFHLYLE